MIYKGATEKHWKERYNNHKFSFKNGHYTNNTKLSKYV